MKTSRQETKYLVFALCLMAAVALWASVAFAGGTGEGGIACPEGVVANPKYLPPHYTGTVTLLYGAYDEGSTGIYMYGYVQQGGANCYGYFPALSASPYFLGAPENGQSYFEALTTAQLIGTCQDFSGFDYFFCNGSAVYGYFQIIGAENLKSMPDGSKTVDVTIMQVVQRK